MKHFIYLCLFVCLSSLTIIIFAANAQVGGLDAGINESIEENAKKVGLDGGTPDASGADAGVPAGVPDAGPKEEKKKEPVKIFLEYDFLNPKEYDNKGVRDGVYFEYNKTLRRWKAQDSVFDVDFDDDDKKNAYFKDQKAKSDVVVSLRDKPKPNSKPYKTGAKAGSTNGQILSNFICPLNLSDLEVNEEHTKKSGFKVYQMGEASQAVLYSEKIERMARENCGNALGKAIMKDTKIADKNQFMSGCYANYISSFYKYSKKEFAKKSCQRYIGAIKGFNMGDMDAWLFCQKHAGKRSETGIKKVAKSRSIKGCKDNAYLSSKGFSKNLTGYKVHDRRARKFPFIKSCRAYFEEQFIRAAGALSSCIRGGTKSTANVKRVPKSKRKAAKRPSQAKTKK